MGNLVSQYCRQFGFIIGKKDQSTVHIQESAWKGERIGFLGVNHFERERKPCVGIAH
jgi:hypothetical protein